MEKQRRLDYNKVIENNNIIDKIYTRLSDLEINNEKNNEEYNNLLAIIKKYSLINERIMKKYSLSDGDLFYFMNSLLQTNEDAKTEDEFNLSFDNVKNIRFVNYVSEESIYYDDDYFKENYLKNELCIYLNNVEYNVEDALKALKTKFNYTEEEAKEYMDEILEEYQKQDDPVFEQSNLLNNYERKITKAEENLYIHTQMSYLLDAIENEKDIKVKNLLIKYKYKYIACYKTLEDFFLKNTNDFIKTNFYQKRILEIVNKDSKEAKNFMDAWNEYYLQVIESLITVLVSLDNGNKLKSKEKARNILVNCSIKAYSSILLSDKFHKLSNNYDFKAIQAAKSEEIKALLSDAKKLKKDLILSEKLKNK